MVLSPLEQRLVAALEGMEIIDAHEHLVPEKYRVNTPVDVFTLFAHYTYGDLRTAGMSDQEYWTVRNHDLPLDYRWRVFSPYWEQIRWTSYSRSALIAAKRFYDADDINVSTYVDISERMRPANTPGIYERVLREACNIRTCLTQWLAQSRVTDFGTPLLKPVMFILRVDFEPDPFRWGLQSWSEIPGEGSIRSLDDLVAAGRAHISQVKAEGAAGVKMVSHPFQAPDRQAAHEAFEQLRTGAASELPATNPLRDYVVDELIRYAGEQDLTVAVHTGYWGDFRRLNPLHMIPTLQRHPEVRFDLYHLGYPWVRESLMLGKQLSNVWLNFCWTHIISQRFAMDALDEAIDLLPMNKVIGFGGDYNFAVEKVYGHLVMAREDIARVLARRIERGQMNEDQALGLARKWLWDNPKELYRLDV